MTHTNKQILADSKLNTTAFGQARRLRFGLVLSALALMTSGCGGMPVTGPLASAIQREASDQAPPFMLVPVSRLTLSALGTVDPEDFTPLATPQPVPESTIHVGDMISVTLWEFGSGLLGPVYNAAAQPGLVGAQSATVPRQTVDQSGLIIVPFAGDIRAAGRTPRQVQAAIVAALRGKANAAQALVQIVETTDNSVTVTGDVTRPGRFPLSVAGTRLLDAVSVAGGSTGKSRDTLVQLTRGGQVHSLRMATVLADPAQNIYLKPGDLIVLDQQPQSVVVLGATNRNAEIPFGKSRITLAEALGNGGGLADRQADPYGVYVLRYERRSIANRLRTDAVPDYLLVGETVPVVYQVNMKSADGMLLAQSFVMRDRDLVYVANSPSVQFGKLVQLFNTASSIVKGNTTNPYTNQF